MGNDGRRELKGKREEKSRSSEEDDADERLNSQRNKAC